MDWVIYLRSDLDFLAPHPPLTPMAAMGPGRVWIPDVMDWGGLNDRWAVMSRDVAPVYLGRIRDLIDGNILPAIQRDFAVTNFSQMLNSEHPINAERMLQMSLHYHGIWPKRVHRFLGTAALHCTAKTKKTLRPSTSAISAGTMACKSDQRSEVLRTDIHCARPIGLARLV